MSVDTVKQVQANGPELPPFGAAVPELGHSSAAHLLVCAVEIDGSKKEKSTMWKVIPDIKAHVKIPA